MSPTHLQRRRFLQLLVGSVASLPLLSGPRLARGDNPTGARRLIVFYFPDGIAGRSQNGEASLWPPTMNGANVQLSELLQPLSGMERKCVFLTGLSMGPVDEGSHPGGAKKLLTGVDGGNGASIDQYLANTAGASAPFRHLYLGAAATANNASGDKFISYPNADVTAAPEDDPVAAFTRLFSSGTTGTTQPMRAPPGMSAADDRSILDVALADLNDLRARAMPDEQAKLDQHLQSLRELELRLQAMSTMTTPDPGASCTSPTLGFTAMSRQALLAPENFPAVLRAQTDLMVTAMACGLTRVGVLQASQHTSELIMSRFMGSEMYDPNFDMRSHQASHYGARQDRSNRLFTDYVKQVRWWVAQFNYLLQRLDARPEGTGTMLDNSLVLLCSEVSDGNTHSHQDMPFVLAGGAGGMLRGGRVLDFGGRRHGDLLATLAAAMGQTVHGYGTDSSGTLPGVLG